MIEIKSKEIAGFKYEVTQLGAKKGRAVLIRLAKVIGPAISALVSADDFESAAGPALTNLCSQLNEDDFAYISDTMADCTKLVQIATTSDGQKEIKTALSSLFDDHFRGRYLPMMQWLVFTLEVNFLDFLGGQSLASLGGLIRAKSPFQSRQNLTGSSGE